MPEFGETKAGRLTHIVGSRDRENLAFAKCSVYLPMTYPSERTVAELLKREFDWLCEKCRRRLR